MSNPPRIMFPLDGDVLNRHDGVETPESLTLIVRGTAPAGLPVEVNGAPARRDGDAFACEVSITRRRTELVARCGGHTHAIAVWWNQGSQKRFRFSCDDNIEFLKDLGLAPQAFRSLFDHWYLAFWREMHRTFGAKIHLNIYYQTDGFDLTQMSDRWKEEWQANADWLHLSFHALQDKPDRPYRHARYAQIAHDYDLVCGNIRRFAGNEVLSSTTTVHWAECPKDGVRALRDRGIETMPGLFEVVAANPDTAYYLDAEQRSHCCRRAAWHDAETGITFINCAMVVNCFEVEEIAPKLTAQASISPHAAEIIELIIHEQYFRKELTYYQPTVFDKVRAALGWVAEREYEPVFWSDGFLGTPVRPAKG